MNALIPSRIQGRLFEGWIISPRMTISMKLPFSGNTLPRKSKILQYLAHSCRDVGRSTCPAWKATVQSPAGGNPYFHISFTCNGFEPVLGRGGAVELHPGLEEHHPGA